MKRFKNILYIIESISSVSNIPGVVQNLARLNGAKVHIGILQEQVPAHNINSRGFLRRMEKLRRNLKENHEVFLHSILQEEDWAGVELTGSIISGIEFIEITKKVLREKHDLIIIEEPTLTRIKIGQLAMKLVRKSPCPVWIIRSQPQAGMKNILAAVDVQQGAETHNLNGKIVQLADSLAGREQGSAHFIHVYSLELGTALSGAQFKVPANEIAAMKEEVMKNSKRLMAKTLEEAQLKINENRIMLREGDPVEVIQQVIQDLAIDTLVMGSVTHSDIPGFLMGNRAERILTEIECSVLTVKPDNFISPITLE